MTDSTPCTCKAEHWQPHKADCPRAVFDKYNSTTALDVTRYDPIEYDMEECEDGGYVRFHDYEQLRLDLAQHLGNASKVIRLQEQVNDAAKILARALADDSEWMLDATRFLSGRK